MKSHIFSYSILPVLFWKKTHTFSTFSSWMSIPALLMDWLRDSKLKNPDKP